MDTELDPHSAKLKVLVVPYWMGMKNNACETRFDKINDLKNFLILWLNKYAFLPIFLANIIYYGSLIGFTMKAIYQDSNFNMALY